MAARGRSPGTSKILHTDFEQRRYDIREVSRASQEGSNDNSSGSGRIDFQTARRRSIGTTSTSSATKTGTDASNRRQRDTDDPSPVCLSHDAFDFVADQDPCRREHSLGLRIGSGGASGTSSCDRS